jgi:flagellar FliL protein
MATAKPAAPAEEAPVDAVPAAPKKGKKKLLIIVIVAVLLLVVLGGGAAVVVMKKKAAHAAELSEDGEPVEAAEAAEKPHKKAGPPTFVPLDPFTVNLADKESDRFAQIAVTLQIGDAKAGDQIKLYMPAIRNNILMVLASKTSDQLLDRAGKEAVAREILRECLKAMDVEVDAAGKVINEDPDDDEEHAPPIEQVLFANFIIQ